MLNLSEFGYIAAGNTSVFQFGWILAMVSLALPS